MTSPPLQKAALRKLSDASGLIVVLIGSAGFLGWAFDVGLLKSAVPGLVEMKANTAVCFILTGLALVFSRDRTCGGLSDGLIGLSLVIALVTLLHYATGWNSGLDELFFEDRFSRKIGLPPGRMALATAVTFVLIGVARLLSWRGRRLVIAQGLVFFAVLIPLFSFLGYLFGERAITLASPYSSLAINTVFSFFVLGAGVLCECSDQGAMAVMVADDSGGFTLRTLLPGTVGVTLLLGFLAFHGARLGFYGYAAGMVIFAVVTAVSLTVAIWVNASFLSLAEAERNRERVWLRSTLASIGDGVIATDSSSRVLFMNHVAEELTGWNSVDSQGSRLADVFRIFNESTRLPTANPVEKALASGTVVGLANHTVLIARDGAEYPIDDSASPIKDALGVTSGVVLVFRNVKERKQAEAERERLVDRLREEDRRKDEFLAMLAHELRNPLSAINNAVQLRAMSQNPEHQNWSVDVINRQMKHLTRLIDDLLDVSRISRGKIELRKERVEASSILDHAVASVRNPIEIRGHRLELDMDAGNLWIDADPTRIEQVVVNLLTNAAKFSEDQGSIRLQARKEGQEIAIVVEDRGVGIPPEKLSTMFELFAQGERSIARSEGGLGIGLTVVKKLVEMHGGNVEASSEGPGKGSKFVIRLPASERPSTLGPPKAEAPCARPSLKARILVVDDNEDTAKGMSRLLKMIGHEVAMAHDGPDALETAERLRPEIVLLDIGLPGMDGYEVASRLRRQEWCKSAKLIAITGYGKDEDRRRSKEAGFDHHFLKPLDHDALLAVITSGIV